MFTWLSTNGGDKRDAVRIQAVEAWEMFTTSMMAQCSLDPIQARITKTGRLSFGFCVLCCVVFFFFLIGMGMGMMLCTHRVIVFCAAYLDYVGRGLVVDPTAFSGGLELSLHLQAATSLKRFAVAT